MDTASSRTPEARRAPIARTLLPTLLLAALLWAVPPARGARAAGFADPAFRDVWARNDGPVAAGGGAPPPPPGAGAGPAPPAGGGGGGGRGPRPLPRLRQKHAQEHHPTGRPA